jgi:hypothetical protein
MKTQHPLKDIIYAMVDDTPVQLRRYGTSEWLDWEAGSVTPFSNSAISFDWRIKPEPKPDVVVRGYCTKDSWGVVLRPTQNNSNLKLTFEGETGQLKSAEVI